MRHLAAVLALVAFRAGDCRPRNPAPVWYHDLATAGAASAAARKPMVVFFGATWDMASHEMRHRALADPEVGALLADRFVAADLDCSDTDSPTVTEAEERFGVRAVPTLIVVTPGAAAELRRFTSFVSPHDLAEALRSVR